MLFATFFRSTREHRASADVPYLDFLRAVFPRLFKRETGCMGACSSRVPLRMAGQFRRRICLEERRIHEAVSEALFVGKVEIPSLRDQVSFLWVFLFEFSAIKRKSVMDLKSNLTGHRILAALLSPPHLIPEIEIPSFLLFASDERPRNNIFPRSANIFQIPWERNNIFPRNVDIFQKIFHSKHPSRSTKNKSLLCTSPRILKRRWEWRIFEKDQRSLICMYITDWGSGYQVLRLLFVCYFEILLPRSSAFSF